MEVSEPAEGRQPGAARAGSTQFNFERPAAGHLHMDVNSVTGKVNPTSNY